MSGEVGLPGRGRSYDLSAWAGEEQTKIAATRLQGRGKRKEGEGRAKRVSGHPGAGKRPSSVPPSE